MNALIFPVLISFTAVLALGPAVIPMLQKLKFGQVVRDDGPESHLKKTGTPTMGGVLIIAAVFASILIMVRYYDPYTTVAIIAVLGFGLVGAADDYLKITKKNSKGLRAWQKLLLQAVLAAVIAVYAYKHVGSSILIPFTNIQWDLDIFIVPFMILVILFMVNSVNLTDGLDGLASSVSVAYFGAYSLVFLNGILPSGENLMVISAAFTGACLGFLRFNRFPARIFMGDTGSLALGGAVVYMAVVTKTMLWLPIMGFMFIISSISVIIQVFFYKLKGKRIFKMAPIHHHFELKGYHETTIVSIYTIISILLCLVGMAAIR